MFSGIVFNPEFQLVIRVQRFTISSPGPASLKLMRKLRCGQTRAAAKTMEPFRNRDVFLVILGHLLISWLIRLVKVYQFGLITE